MDSKYYTPEIEEFCVGFEYQYAESGIFQNNEDDEVACDLECDPIEQIRADILNGRIRVKHLDREGIESLGWEIDRIFSIGDENTFTIEVDSVRYGLDVSYSGGRVAIGAADEDEEIHIIFYGNVKNKSELKKLMKQLNINNEKST